MITNCRHTMEADHSRSRYLNYKGMYIRRFCSQFMSYENLFMAQIYPNKAKAEKNYVQKS